MSDLGPFRQNSKTDYSTPLFHSFDLLSLIRSDKLHESCYAIERSDDKQLRCNGKLDAVNTNGYTSSDEKGREKWLLLYRRYSTGISLAQ